MEMFAGEPHPVAVTQGINSVTTHLESLEERQEQHYAQKWRYERGYWF